MFHACVQKFDVTGNLEKILEQGLNVASECGSLTCPVWLVQGLSKYVTFSMTNLLVSFELISLIVLNVIYLKIDTPRYWWGIYKRAWPPIGISWPNMYLARELPGAFRLDREKEMFDSKHSYNEKSGNSTFNGVAPHFIIRNFLQIPMERGIS